MPYILNTERELPSAEDSSTLTIRERRAVATLREAQQDARNAVEDHAQEPGWTPEWIAAREVARSLPESGGKIDLPDGTTIEVESTDYMRLADDAGLVARMGRVWEPHEIIDAFNAAQS